MIPKLRTTALQTHIPSNPGRQPGTGKSYLSKLRRQARHGSYKRSPVRCGQYRASSEGKREASLWNTGPSTKQSVWGSVSTLASAGGHLGSFLRRSLPRHRASQLNQSLWGEGQRPRPGMLKNSVPHRILWCMGGRNHTDFVLKINDQPDQKPAAKRGLRGEVQWWRACPAWLRP